MTSSQERAAGSRSRTEFTSSRIRANIVVPFSFQILRDWRAASSSEFAAHLFTVSYSLFTVSHRNRLRRLRQHFLPQRIEQDTRQVSLAKVRKHHHDQLAGIFGPRSHLQRC